MNALNVQLKQYNFSIVCVFVRNPFYSTRDKQVYTGHADHNQATIIAVTKNPPVKTSRNAFGGDEINFIDMFDAHGKGMVKN